MRHASASILLGAGVPPAVAAKMMGHGVTLFCETYADLLVEATRDAADTWRAGSWRRSMLHSRVQRAGVGRRCPSAGGVRGPRDSLAAGAGGRGSAAKVQQTEAPLGVYPWRGFHFPLILEVIPWCAPEDLNPRPTDP